MNSNEIQPGNSSDSGVLSSLRPILASMCFIAMCMPALPLRSADHDNDGIPDEFEDELLQRFAPVVKIDQLNTTPGEFRAIPVSASWFAQHTDLGYMTNRPGLVGAVFQPVLASPTPESLLIYSIVNRSAASRLLLKFRDEDWKWGDSPIDPTSWPDAIARRRGVYGRVWHPWPERYPNLYSVQYFMLFTWNESGDCDVFNDFRHDGDIMCVDYGVDASAIGGPAIIHGIYHVHGKQIFVTRDALNFENEHPLVFLERGSNESWPNAGTDGEAGWPQMDGFALSEFICDILPEECCVRQHQGLGNVYATANVPNIGEAPWPEGASVEGRAYFPLGSLDNQLFLQYPGGWGRRGGPPEGPAFQSKMWRREVDGPWAAFGRYGGEDPLRPNLEAMSLLKPSFVNGTEVGHRDFLPVCDVRVSNPGLQKGLPSRPYVTISQGAQKVATYGVLRVGPGAYAETLEVTKPMLIESAGGMVTIGR